MMRDKEIIRGLKELKKTIKPDSAWQAKSQAYLLAYFQEKFPAPLQERRRFFVLKTAFTSLLVLVILLLAGFSTPYAAKHSLPGESLYPVKRFSEKVKISLTFNQQEKTILRAELLSTRFTEAKVLAGKINKEDGQKITPKLVVAAQEMHREIKSLKREIAAQVTQPLVDVTFDEGSLPIQDGREVAKIVLSPELEKTLKQTETLLKEKNLVAALAKTTEAEKYLTEPTDALITTPEILESEEEKAPTQTESPRLPLKQTAPTESVTESVKQILEKKLEDFKIEPVREEPMKVDPIRE